MMTRRDRDARGPQNSTVSLRATPSWMLIALSVVAVACAPSRFSWRPPLRMGGTEEVQLSSATVAGRVAEIESVAARANGMSDDEMSGLVESLVSDLSRDTTAAPVKLAAVRCLESMPVPLRLQALTVASSDADPAVRDAAYRALGQVDSPESLRLLATAVGQETNVDCKLTAIRALGRFRDPRTVQTLGKTLDDRDPAIQFASMQALEQATGERLGEDVRRWKELAADPATAVAGRGSNSRR